MVKAWRTGGRYCRECRSVIDNLVQRLCDDQCVQLFLEGEAALMMDTDALKATAKKLGMTEPQVREVIRTYADEVVKLGHHIMPAKPARKRTAAPSPGAKDKVSQPA